MKNVLACMLVLCTGTAFAQVTTVDNTVANGVIAVQNACAKLSADLQTVQTDIQAVQAAGGIVLANPPPSPPPTGPTESTDGTTVTPGNGVILDISLVQWSLSPATFILKSGVTAYNGWQSNKMVYHNHLVFILGLDGNWYSWNGSAFVKSAAPI